MIRAVACLVTVLGVAQAFVSPAVNVQRQGMRMSLSVNDLVGADVETGGLWDPLGFSNDADALYRRRVVEIKHGRIAMLAVLGNIVQQLVHLPDPAFSNSRPVAALFQVFNEKPVALVQIVGAIAWFELTIGKQDESKAPGDIFGDFGKDFIPNDPAEYEKMQLRELKNGRLAMLAIMGEMVTEKLTGLAPLEQWAVGKVLPF